VIDCFIYVKGAISSSWETHLTTTGRPLGPTLSL